MCFKCFRFVRSHNAASRLEDGTRTAWSDRSHQSVHLDVPVFDVGACLAKLPLSSLSENEGNSLKLMQLMLALPQTTANKYKYYESFHTKVKRKTF